MTILPAQAQQLPQKVVEVVVTGNENINSETILNVVSMRPGDDFTESVVEKDLTAIRGLGYFSAVTLHKKEVTGGVIVYYEVTENPVITAVQIIGNEPVPEEKVRSLMKTEPGQVLNETTVKQDIDAIEEYYFDEGYMAYVTEDIGIDAETKVLTIPILVHTVASIEITGNKKTREFVFLREMKTKVGDVYNQKVLNKDLINIYELNILEDIKTPKLVRGADPGTVNITLPVEEKKTGQIALGVGYSSKQQLVGQARVSETNFRGMGQGLSLLWEQGTGDGVEGNSSYEVEFYEPWLDDKHTSLSVRAYNKLLYRFSSGVFGSSTLDSDTDYNERRKGASVTLSRPFGEHHRVFLGGRFENVNTDPSQFGSTDDYYKVTQKGDLAVGSLKYVNNTRDYALDPATGGYDGYTVELGQVNATRFGAPPNYPQTEFDGTFAKVLVDIRRYYSKGGPKTSPKDKRDTLALRLMGGYAKGTLPFFEQFFMGGGDTLRGYREDRFWGRQMFLFSAEYRKPLAESMSGVAFVDYGDAWGSTEDFTLNELSQHDNFDGNLGYGVGIRVTTPIGQLRFDYGMGSEGSRTHFSLGQAF